MKGVSEIVVVLLILLIVISSVSVLYFYFYNSFTSASLSNQTIVLSETLSSCMKIESANDNKVYLRNCGSGVIRNYSLNIYLDETPISFFMANSTLSKNEIGIVNINVNIQNLEIGDHEIKITSPSAKVERFVKVFTIGSTNEVVNSIVNLGFNESKGAVAYDSSPSHNNGFFSGERLDNGTLGDSACNPGSGKCPSRLDGVFGKALDFDGVDDYVLVPDSAILDISNAITITAWIFPQGWGGSERGRIVNKAGAYMFYVDNPDVPQSLRLYMTNTGGSTVQGWSGQNALSLNAWYHVAVTYDGLTVKFYVSGVQSVGQTSGSGSIAVTGNDMYIGNNNAGDRQFNGIIDEVRIWNRVLTQSEIQDEMQSYLPIKRPASSWSFEEPSSARYVNDTHIWVKGNGSALNFDGANDYVQVPNSNSLNPTSELTIGAWIKLNQLATSKGESMVVVGKKHSADPWNSYRIAVDSSNNKIIFSVVNSDTHEWVNTGSSTALTTGVWYYVACVLNGTSHRPTIYVNSIDDTSWSAGTFTGTVFRSDYSLNIGADWSGGLRFNGTIDELNIFDRALSQSEIQTVMRGGQITRTTQGGITLALEEMA